MPFSKFECKDVGIPTYKRDKRENDDNHKPLSLKSPFIEVEIEGKESIFIQKRTAVHGFLRKPNKGYLQTVCYECM